METERKFLVSSLPDLSLAMKHSAIVQAYMSINPEIRVRNIDNLCFLTQKSEGTLSREEIEYEITIDEYIEKVKSKIGNDIQKMRYFYALYNGYIAELDIYSSHLSGLQVVEVEFPNECSANLFIPPDWFGPEITNDKRYKNKSLATTGFPIDL